MKRITLAAWSGILSLALIVTLSATLSTNAEAQSSSSGNLDFTADKVLIVVAAVAVVAVVVFVVVHKSGKRTLTGCVSTNPNGMTLMDEKDKQLYVLSGDTSGIVAGDRMKLQVAKVKTKGAPVAWTTRKVVKDFGVCHP